ncbi:hypothetical protein [Streptomyces sp. NPDC003015]
MHQSAERDRVFLCVTVRHDQVAEALRDASGVHPAVTRTLRRAGGGRRRAYRPTAFPLQGSIVRNRFKARLYLVVCADMRGPAMMAAQRR